MTQEDTAKTVRPLGPEREHYWLALSMSQAVGLDLQAEIEAGRFSVAEWADTVQRCRGCTWAEECPGWLAEQGDVDQAPGTCVNAERFNHLLGLPPTPVPAERA